MLFELISPIILFYFCYERFYKDEEDEKVEAGRRYPRLNFTEN